MVQTQNQPNQDLTRRLIEVDKSSTSCVAQTNEDSGSNPDGAPKIAAANARAGGMEQAGWNSEIQITFTRFAKRGPVA